MKDQILKIAKVKSEKEFYKKYPTEEAFMKAHGKAFKKAAMGAKMVNDQLHQLTDFGNPPIAQVGAMIGGSGPVAKRNQPLSFTDIMNNVNATNAGLTREQYDKNQQQAEDRNNAQTIADSNKGGGIGDLLNLGSDLMGKFGGGNKTGKTGVGGIPPEIQDAIGAGFEMRHGGNVYRYQDGGLMNIANMIGGAFEKKGGVGSGIADMFNIGGGSKAISDNATKSFGGGAAATGMGLLNAAPQILKGIGQMKQQDANIAKADQFARIGDATALAAESQEEQARRKYVRPEDSLVQPGQMNSPQGVGTNYLAQNGRSIGGNPTEIQNTYAPSDLYAGLGYEPLNDSNPKQYAYGGNIPTAEFGEYFQSSGQASIGSGIGSALSAVTGIPGLDKLGALAGNAVFGGIDDSRKLHHFEEQGKQNAQRAAWAQGANAIHAQNSSYMKDGGYTDSEHAWVSNGWQPQVITHFGDMNVSQVHNFAHQGMDSLRAGGHLKEYTPPSAEAMYTGRSQYAMGGELKTHWGGKAETMSYNPYLPDGGETVMFRGQSHDETDGRGRSGIGVTYGDSPVEVERGEPAVKLQDGGNPGEDNLVVFGNMQIPTYGVEEIGDKNAKGKKFKNYVADLSKKEAKYNKKIEKATEIVNNADTNNVFDQLSLNSGKAMLMGSNLKLKDIANKKQTAAMVQNAILDTAEEFGVESDGLAKGKIRAIKDPSIGRDGKMLSKAQSGKFVTPTFALDKSVLQNKKYKESGEIPFRERDITGSDVPPLFARMLGAKSKRDYPFNKELSDRLTLGTLNMPQAGTALRTVASSAPSAKATSSKSSGKTTGKKSGKPSASTKAAPKDGLIPINVGPAPQLFPLQPELVPGRDYLSADKFGNYYDEDGNVIDQSGGDLPNSPIGKSFGKSEGKRKGRIDWKDVANTAFSMIPSTRPTNQLPLDPSQLMGEMYALGSNQLEGVQAQTFQPMLDTPYDISLQDQINAINSQARAAILASGQDPAAQAYIMSQAADAKNKVLGEQFRANQANKAQIYQANRQALNQAQLQNLGILDKQYERQSTAKSKTKAQAIAALQSISDKIAQNRLENKTVGVYENMYKYRFGPQGQAINYNDLAQFNPAGSPSSTTSSATGTPPPGYTIQMEPKLVKTKNGGKIASRNGSIVKAVKLKNI